MPSSSKPRKRYRPKQTITNAAAYVIESSTMLKDHGTYAVDWKLKNNTAFEKLMRGNAGFNEMNVLVAANNISLALVHVLKGIDVDNTLANGEKAIEDICDRANAGKGLAMRSSEMTAIRELLKFHDELIDVVTVRQFEEALAYARELTAKGNTKRLRRIS